MIIFIDESGTLPDPKDKVIIIAAIGTNLPNKLLNINRKVFDRHFHQDKDEKKFNRILRTLLGKQLPIDHVDSLENVTVNAVDMVAGSALWAYSGKETKFYKLLLDNIIVEKILNWKEAKRKFYQKLKTSSNRRKRPS